ncbi:M20/M25/M40 family metallo-hydrolase [Prescottella defluvii]|nr:M20/M25/M40 family metallo-hydrolase [Prescottella defluvii]
MHPGRDGPRVRGVLPARGRTVRHPGRDRECGGGRGRAGSVDAAHPPAITWQMHYPGGRTDGDHPFCLTVAGARTRATARTRLDGAPDVMPFPSATDLTWLSRAGIPTVGLGPGSLSMAHAVDERCAIDEIICAAKTYAFSAINWCGVE